MSSHNRRCRAFIASDSEGSEDSDQENRRIRDDSSNSNSERTSSGLSIEQFAELPGIQTRNDASTQPPAIDYAAAQRSAKEQYLASLRVRLRREPERQRRFATPYSRPSASAQFRFRRASGNSSLPNMRRDFHVTPVIEANEDNAHEFSDESVFDIFAGESDINEPNEAIEGETQTSTTETPLTAGTTVTVTTVTTMTTATPAVLATLQAAAETQPAAITPAVTESSGVPTQVSRGIQARPPAPVEFLCQMTFSPFLRDNLPQLTINNLSPNNPPPPLTQPSSTPGQNPQQTPERIENAINLRMSRELERLEIRRCIRLALRRVRAADRYIRRRRNFRLVLRDNLPLIMYEMEHRLQCAETEIETLLIRLAEDQQ